MSETYRRYAISREMDGLVSGLHSLLSQHREAFEEEGMTEELKQVINWAERYSTGSASAGRHLEQEGVVALRKMQRRLALAMGDQQRIAAESPTIALDQEGKQEEFAEARQQVSELTRLLLENLHHELMTGEI